MSSFHPIKISEDWRKLAILLACITFIFEGVIIAIWFLQMQQQIVDIGYPLAGIAFSLLVGIIWIAHPRTSKQEETGEKEMADNSDDATLTQTESVNSQDIDILQPVVSMSQSKTEKKPHFALTETRWFILSKDGEEFEYCENSEDKLAVNDSLRCYAIADGAAQSFLPGKWASYLVEDFVNYEAFSGQNIESWLRKCKEQWQEWAKSDWLPEARATGLYLPGELEKHLDQGPYATFVGCKVHLITGTTANIQVFALGDAHFFLYCPDQPVGDRLKYFPYKSCQEFGQPPEALGISERRIKRAYELMKQEVYDGVSLEEGVAILTSDELAKWICLQKETANYNILDELFKIIIWDDFKEFVVQKIRASSEIRLDDMTMIVIPLRQFIISG